MRTIIILISGLGSIIALIYSILVYSKLISGIEIIPDLIISMGFAIICSHIFLHEIMMDKIEK